jgi:hypothetical protein
MELPMPTRHRLPLLIAITATATFVSTLHATATTSSNECISTSSDGQQYWVGEQPADLSNMMDELQSLVLQNPGQATGVANCSNYEGAIVFETAIDGTFSDKVREVSAKYPQYSVQFTTVPNSRSALLKMVNTVVQQPDMVNDKIGAAPDIYSGGILLLVHSNVPETRAEDNVILTRAAAVLGADVPIRIRRSPFSQGSSNTSGSDHSPYTMGAKLNSSSGYCSLGIPIIVNEEHMALTAGHCAGASYTNNGTVGTQYTSAYPGNVGIYGDFKVLHGADYRLQVFSGHTWQSNVLPINAVNWGLRSPGDGMCGSGATTGGICRYKVSGVIDTNDYVTANGVTLLSGHMTIILHDGNLDLNYDCDGWTHGDSGGPIYYGDGLGGVVVAGIITSSTEDFPCEYYYTELKAVRLWNSSVLVGGY